MELKPIHQNLSENTAFAENPITRDSLHMTLDFYKRVGFLPPWIGYYVTENETIVGAAGFKGSPVDGKTEVAYGTFEPYQNQGIGTKICRALVEISLQTDPSIRITARTLPENNFSTKILRKNGFGFIGTVADPEDGNVWEWEYQENQISHLDD